METPTQNHEERRVVRWLKGRLAGRQFTLPILSGTGRGLRWPHTSRGVHAYWLGTYEKHVQTALAHHLRRGDGFCDIGSQCGFFSLLASRLVGREGSIVSVEADPGNCSVIERVRNLNPHPGWQIMNAVCGATAGPRRFYFRGAFTSSISAQDDAETEGALLPGLTLPQILGQVGGRILVKMDIEGAEAEVFSALDAGQLPAETSFLVEIHNQAALDAIQAFGERSGYCLTNPFAGEAALPRAWGMHRLEPRPASRPVPPGYSEKPRP